MGRSVSTPNNCIVVAYKDIRDFGMAYDDDGNVIEGEFDYDQGMFDMEDLISDIRAEAMARWPSFYEVDGWQGREDQILLQNDFAEIGISSYGGLAAIWLRSTRDDNDQYIPDQIRLANLSENWCSKIARNFEALFGDCKMIGRMSNGESVYERVA
jgi:hypothetical protein